MKTFTSFASLCICIAITSCVSGAIGPAAPDDAYSSDYVKTADRFLLRLANNSGRELCLWNAVWPSEQGWTGHVVGTPYVVVGDNKFDYGKKFSAIGHSNNSTRIGPGEQVKRELLYSDFAPFDSESDFELVLDPKPFYC